MSGIVGTWRFDGRPADKRELYRMLQSLAHRGPDASGIWNDGSVGLGHAMLWGTPQAPRERLPLTNSLSDLTITADARIDNRVELIDVLGTGGYPPDAIPDSELILRAYERWGEDCAAKLIGDFAFAIWDGRKQALFLARDHFGVKPLCYYHSEKIFAFASEIKALLCLSEVPQQINEARIGDFLFGVTEDINNSCTFYERIFRLVPAKTMIVDHKSTRTQSYWSPDSTKEIRYRSDEEYAEAFLQILTEAVDCRLRGIAVPGTMLSGGLDSSSIVGVAHTLLSKNGKGLMPIFSRISEESTNCGVTRSINAVVTAMPELQLHAITGRDAPTFVEDVDLAMGRMDDLFDTYFMDHRLMLYSLAHNSGVKALFDGIEGDIITSNRERYIEFILRSGAVRTAIREAVGYCEYLSNLSGPPAPWKMIFHWSGAAFVPHAVKKIGVVERMRAKILGALPIKCITENSIIDIDFASRIDLEGRYEEMRKNRHPYVATTLREHQLQLLRAPIITAAVERYDRMAANFSVEARHPLLDMRLAEFCLALPWQQTNRNGWPKAILRKGMTRILPEEVRTQKSAGSLCRSTLRDAWLQHNRNRLRDMIDNPSGKIERFVRGPVVQHALHRYTRGGASVQDRHNLWTAAVLAAWLTREADRNPK